MQHALEVFQQYQDKIIHVLQWLAGLGIVDVLLRKLPTEKPRSLLIALQSGLKVVIKMLQGVDSILDNVPGLSQNVKVEEKK